MVSRMMAQYFGWRARHIKEVAIRRYNRECELDFERATKRLLNAHRRWVYFQASSARFYQRIGGVR